MRVLVTGGAGYIGSHTCKALSRAGHVPLAFDNLSTGHADAVKWGPLFVGDILDGQALDAAFLAHRPQAVVHFAALAYVGESVTEPGRYYRNNVGGTQNLLEAMRRHQVPSIVLSSTCATYGIPQALPISEDMPQQPVNPYGQTKLVMERMAADYERAHGIRSVSLRYFNAAGADPEGELGERHEPETHAIPLAIGAALGIAPPFHVLGTDYPTPDGSAVRDYVHVNDLADAHVRAVSYLANGGASTACNLGTGNGTSVLEMVEAVQAVTGRAVPLVHAARRAGDPPALYAKAERAHALLGWTPRFTGVAPIIETAVAWHRAAPGGASDPAGIAPRKETATVEQGERG